MPSYDFNDFKAACGKKNNVFIWSQASEDADRLFNLKTIGKLLDFIHNDGLEDLKFQNAKLLEIGPDKGVMVDAYEFRTMNIRGYIAFYYNEKTKNWIIKSFKFSNKTNLTMADAFNKAILKIENKLGEKNE